MKIYKNDKNNYYYIIILNNANNKFKKQLKLDMVEI